MSSATVPPPTRRKPWEEANPVISGVLAYLIPGAGHLYQGRYFKGLVYLVCIHGAFFTGMCLGEGMTVHNKIPPRVRDAEWWKKISLSYIPQLGNGLWALPALWQMKRVEAKDNELVYSLKSPLTTSFTGEVKGSGPGSDDFKGKVVGTISLHPAKDAVGQGVEGTFVGTQDGKPVELALASGLNPNSPILDKPIGASPDRELNINILHEPDQHPQLKLNLEGVVPRPLWNWYEVPPTKGQLEEITGRLGKYFELALVFTWIAGLLNILAVWDCVKGPSLGFGDEPPAGPNPAEPSTEKKEKEVLKTAEKPVPAVAAPPEKGK